MDNHHLDSKNELAFLESEIERLENVVANEQTSEVLLDTINTYNAKSPRLRWILGITLLMVIVLFYVSYNIYISKPAFIKQTILFIEDVFNPKLINFILVGLAAQMVDGALGMAYITS